MAKMADSRPATLDDSLLGENARKAVDRGLAGSPSINSDPRDTRFLRVGLFGNNGHQVYTKLIDHPRARLVACADFNPVGHPDPPAVTAHAGLDSLLGDSKVELVVLCSPIRAEQAGHAIAALRAGKHVYAEKPCALSEEDLDSILEEASKCGRVFREMAGTAFESPYQEMREIVQGGHLGEVIQIIAQKCYPWKDWRPQDERVDGGLICQCAVHAARWVEHVACRKIESIIAQETTAGNPQPGGGLRMASSLMMRLDNGGLASITANYLNQKGTGVHGYESLVIHGTKGLVQSLRGGAETRLFLGPNDLGPIKLHPQTQSYFDRLVDHILDGSPMPLSVMEEVRPTRWMIRAKASANGAFSAPSMS